ncbi:Mo-dependent nitrogenase C-terminal domain-containing protein [Ancylothrix sp. C2]|uniref:Mo-dependent nitrogenase C-terminal domain-containing protein n=1 Tax=Ancylothrix sp. D3o TaxID=2953691 RepID=UPI0021BB2838|nr:Mo-dependent nitrogenase C-terminal domain-containing protein [Ancylothrix sp. D3o]MCT7952493.1 Mo-dependent nitrogenase C-terminal domain-containing protein [Ancylothrix sp. D3o]
MICTNENTPTLLSAFSAILGNFKADQSGKLDLLKPLRTRLDGLEIRDRQLAEFLYKAIPAQCPFARDIVVFGRKIGHIPPMCKLNPLYDQLMGLRFRAMCYLVDECGLDLQSFA